MVFFMLCHSYSWFRLVCDNLPVVWIALACFAISLIFVGDMCPRRWCQRKNSADVSCSRWFCLSSLSCSFSLRPSRPSRLNSPWTGEPRTCNRRPIHSASSSSSLTSVTMFGSSFRSGSYPSPSGSSTSAEKARYLLYPGADRILPTLMLLGSSGAVLFILSSVPPWLKTIVVSTVPCSSLFLDPVPFVPNAVDAKCLILFGFGTYMGSWQQYSMHFPFVVFDVPLYGSIVFWFVEDSLGYFVGWH